MTDILRDRNTGVSLNYNLKSRIQVSYNTSYSDQSKIEDHINAIEWQLPFMSLADKKFSVSYSSSCFP